MNSYFVEPKLIKTSEDKFYVDSYSYTHYNYLRGGISSKFKIEHFELALILTKNDFRKKNVIDFGCGDGAFLPSLSRYFNNVVGIDINPQFIEIAKKLIIEQELKNVTCVTNKDIPFTLLSSKINQSVEYDILFLLQMLEHVGEHGLNQHKSRLEFLRKASKLIKSNGKIIVSVPKMVGLSFILQRIGLFIFGLDREKYTLKEFLSAVFNKTLDLEKQYEGYHRGFNHTKFEKSLKGEFVIEKKISTLFQVIYLLRTS